MLTILSIYIIIRAQLGGKEMRDARDAIGGYIADQFRHDFQKPSHGGPMEMALRKQREMLQQTCRRCAS
jgi:hypothetical protein